MFKLNAERVKAFDAKGNFINEAGKYKGVFTRVEWIDKSSTTGSTGLGLTFVSDSKQEANIYVNISVLPPTVQ